jgi:hypothetical protein
MLTVGRNRDRKIFACAWKSVLKVKGAQGLATTQYNQGVIQLFSHGKTDSNDFATAGKTNCNVNKRCLLTTGSECEQQKQTHCKKINFKVNV